MTTDGPDVRERVKELSARLIEGSTATGTLHAWCEEHRLSQGPITVVRLHHAHAPEPPEDVLVKLETRPGETVWYRRVQLVRGSLVLSDAENWFIPQRLSPEAADILAATDIPFAVAIAPLKPFRCTLSVSFPVPTQADFSKSVLEHEAVVLGEDGAPLAAAREKYRAELVSF